MLAMYTRMYYNEFAKFRTFYTNIWFKKRKREETKLKSVKKALLLLLCAVLVVGASVFGTLAYLTDTEAVTNTFSVGSVGLSLDEAEVTPDGKPVDGADRVHDNEYHLLPGMTYTKDPTIHVDATSEDSYIFVKVDNQIAAYEAASGDGYTNIADQIAANGWTALNGVPNVYYQTYTKGQSDKNLEVFANFKIDGMANTVAGWDAITPETTKVKVTGYAVQKAGFGSAKQAWDAADFPEDVDADVVTNAEEFEKAWQAGGTVKLGADISFGHKSDPNVSLPDIVLDLNGHILSVTYSNGTPNGSLTAYRNMTIMDSQGGGKMYGNGFNAYNNIITITGGTYDIGITGNSRYTITGGEFLGGLVMSSATITGGKFRSDPTSFVNLDTHTVTNTEGWYTVTAK